MIGERSERRMYRKSPGRQYGYEYDPLRSQSLNGYNQQGRPNPVQSEPWNSSDETGSRSGRHTSGLLAPRPNPRRTRQLLRQNIIASKSKSAALEDTGQLDPELRGRYALADGDQQMYESEGDSPLSRNRYPRSSQLLPPEQEHYIEEEEELNEEPYADEELQYMDPDPGYDEYEDNDPLYQRLTYSETPRAKSSNPRVQPETPARGRRRSEPLDYDIDEQEEAPARRKGKKKQGLTRRKLLIGAVAAGGTAVAAYELVPRLPQALEQAGTNIEHQVQDAFNRGLAAGGEAVRKELINSLDTLEGVSLDAAIGAARLTRIAYDVFVSPLVTLAATIADDFLSALLASLTQARKWLAAINADNASLAALQAVLQNWVGQAKNMPKKLQTITETDLDGAQAYLRALQRKIQEEQAKLNGQGTTPAPAPTTKPNH